jgi:hypothetical protein
MKKAESCQAMIQREASDTFDDGQVAPSKRCNQKRMGQSKGCSCLDRMKKKITDPIEILDQYFDLSAKASRDLIETDPLLRSQGSGKLLWADESPDDYVRRLRTVE